MYCNVGLKTSGNQLKNNKSDSFCNNTVSDASREKILYGICEDGKSRFFCAFMKAD